MENKKIDVVSIIIPVYNVEKYIKKCLDSVIKQTYKDIEIILVDDGSTDSSGELCDYYATIDDRVKVIHQVNSGVSVARNQGLSICTGDFITFVDPDDWIDENAIEEMLRTALVHNADIVMCEFYYHHNDGKTGKTNNTRLLQDHRYSKDEIMSDIFPICCCRDLIEGNNTPPLMAVWNKLFARELILKFQFHNKMTMWEDFYLVIKCLMNCNAIYYTKESYYHYRCLDNSASHKFNIATFESKKLLNKLLYKYITLNKTNEDVLYKVFYYKCILDILTVCYRGFNGGVPGGYKSIKKYIISYIDDEINSAAINYYSNNKKDFNRKFELFLLRRKWIEVIYFIAKVKKYMKRC